jgi:two-component system, LytTR family, sensor kinase
MKLRWREHEMIFITILVVAQIIVSFLRMYTPPYQQPTIDFATGFKENGIAFIYWRNVLLPQVSSVLLIYFGYLSINLLILPLIKKISFNDFEKLLTLNFIKPIAAIAIISYLLAIGVNAISYYAKPHLFNYGDYQFLASFGYNDKPLVNLFFGFERAIGFVILFTVLAGLRELIIWFIEKSTAKREFRVLIVNTTTSLIFIYFLILVLINPIHQDFKIYFACVTPVFLLYIYLTFWFFPLKSEITLANRFKVQIHAPSLIRLLLATFICTLPVIFIFENNNRPFSFLAYWAFLLFIVTPLSWLPYRQRKDKIMQLKGMETALAKSDASLQFLRSQINPHFLFNALNTLYGTALKENSEHTAGGIQKLGDMMRFMLHENNLDFIPMEKEIEYLKNYIALQKLRTQSSPDILIEDNIDEAKCNRTIAPMLLIPFVENAFKHGISLKEKSWINIRLDCADNIISFEVRNSIHVRTEGDTEKDKSGIGLKNVSERLKLLYADKQELKIIEDKNEFIAKLIIK